MKRMKKMNNKGFSLVELIVVIAIMAILAVTLAPRLSQYVEKSRRTADNEVVNAIYTAIRLGVLDDDVLEAAQALASPDAFDLNDGTNGLYTVSGKDWSFSTDYDTGGEGDDKLLLEIREVVGEFKLKSSDAGDGTTIKVLVTDTDNISVTLDYDGDADTIDDIYTASDAAVRP